RNCSSLVRNLGRLLRAAELVRVVEHQGIELTDSPLRVGDQLLGLLHLLLGGHVVLRDRGGGGGDDQQGTGDQRAISHGASGAGHNVLFSASPGGHQGQCQHPDAKPSSAS